MKKLLGYIVAILILCTANFSFAKTEDDAMAKEVESMLAFMGPWISSGVYAVRRGKADTTKNYISHGYVKDSGLLGILVFDEKKFIQLPVDVKNGKVPYLSKEKLFNSMTEYTVSAENQQFKYSYTDVSTSTVIERIIKDIFSGNLSFEVLIDDESYLVVYEPYKNVFKSKKLPKEVEEAIKTIRESNRRSDKAVITHRVLKDRKAN